MGPSLLALVFLFPLFSLAGADTVGNGGFGVICESQKAPGYTVQLLDLYESSRLYKFAPDIPKKSKTLITEIRARLNEALQDPILANQVLDGFKNVSIRKNSGTQIPWTVERIFQQGTHDLGVLLAPLEQNCKLVQLAVQVRRNGKWTAYINPYFHSSLTETEYAGLYLHEILHNYFRWNQSSIALRQITMYLMAPQSFRIANREVFRRIIQTYIPAQAHEFQALN